jgi:dynein assembly factor 2
VLPPDLYKSDVIEEPKASKTAQNGQTGTAWSLPHSLTTHKEDIDKHGKPCIVYDAVFHPTALRLARQDGRFKGVRTLQPFSPLGCGLEKDRWPLRR